MNANWIRSQQLCLVKMESLHFPPLNAISSSNHCVNLLSEKHPLRVQFGSEPLLVVYTALAMCVWAPCSLTSSYLKLMDTTGWKRGDGSGASNEVAHLSPAPTQMRCRSIVCVFPWVPLFFISCTLSSLLLPLQYFSEVQYSILLFYIRVLHWEQCITPYILQDQILLYPFCILHF